MVSVFSVLTQALALYLLADFLTGIAHYLIDNVLPYQRTRLARYIVGENNLHHVRPRAMLAYTPWQRLMVPLPFSVGFLLFLGALGMLTWQLAVLVALLTVANEIHALAHQTRRENGPFVLFLQKIGLFQSARHHAGHHSSPFDCRYCVMSNWVNPLLDRLQLWAALDRLFNVKPASR